MAKAKNGTTRPISASVGGTWYHVDPGKTVEADDRTILSLGEYGLTVLNRDTVVRGQDIPETPGETRHTGGRQHDQDDERVNPAGTPVTETGDTGSTTPEPGVQGVEGEKAAAGEPNEVQGGGVKAEKVAASAEKRDAKATAKP